MNEMDDCCVYGPDVDDLPIRDRMNDHWNPRAASGKWIDINRSVVLGRPRMVQVEMVAYQFFMRLLENQVLSFVF